MTRIIAVDLAQTHDFTAITILETQRAPPGEKPVHHVRHLERLQRGTDYASQVRRIHELTEHLPGVELVVDQTGVGRAVVDLMREMHLNPLPVTITSGATENRVDGDWRVPKRDLVTTLQVVLQNGRLKVSASLAEARRWADELLAFTVEISDTGRDTYGNDGSLQAHDDLVISTALAVWRAEQRRSPVISGIFGYQNAAWARRRAGLP